LVIFSFIDQTEGNDVNLTGDRPPRRIDTHHHILPDIFSQAIEEAGGDPSGGPNPKWSVEQAKEHMSQLGIEMAIISISSPGTKIYENNKEKGRAFARQLNEYSADLVKSNPKQFGFFASLPSLTDVEGTLNEIDYVHSTFVPDGYTLFTSYGDDNSHYLGHPSFQSIWAKLNELKTVVFIHPSKPPTTVVDRYLPAPLIDFPQETTRTAADLVTTGTRAMFPDVKIILSHGGGTLPFLAHRISLAGIVPALQCPRNNLQILEDFRSFYFDTALSSSAPQLQALLEFADPSKILFGSDIPYAPFPATLQITKNLDQFFVKNKRDENLLRAINHGNAKRLFPNKVQD
jgi:predicted TIM-barrel fold metal-dependent hydrolase